MDDCFIIPKIHCLHRAQVCINTNKKIEQRRWPSLQTISRLTLLHFIGLACCNLMKLTSLLQVFDNLQQAGKIEDSRQACDVVGCVVARDMLQVVGRRQFFYMFHKRSTKIFGWFKEICQVKGKWQQKILLSHLKETLKQ